MMKAIHVLQANIVPICSLGRPMTLHQRISVVPYATTNGAIAMQMVMVTTIRKMLGIGMHSLSMVLNMPILMKMDMVTTQMATMPTIVP
jgi:hypothetical protein